MKNKPELSKENEKFMRDHYGFTPDELRKEREANPTPSTSDQLFQNVDSDSAWALTRIHKNMSMAGSSGNGSTERPSDSTTPGDSGTV